MTARPTPSTATTGQTAARPTSTATQAEATLGPEYDVYETLVRNAMNGWADEKAKPSALYVMLAGQDPPALFLRRFGDAKLPVKPASAGQDIAKETPVVWMSLAEVEWQGQDRARVMGRVHCSWIQEKCGTPWPMLTGRENGKWVVVVK